MKASPDLRAKHARRKVITQANLKPKRWIVERTFAWFNFFRRLARDFELKTAHSEAIVKIAMAQILLKKINSP
jgi:transposase